MVTFGVRSCSLAENRSSPIPGARSVGRERSGYSLALSRGVAAPSLVVMGTGPVTGPPASGAAAVRTERLRYLDNLKVGLIAAVIAVHGVLGYIDIRDIWPYNAVQETTLAHRCRSSLSSRWSARSRSSRWRCCSSWPAC